MIKYNNFSVSTIPSIIPKKPLIETSARIGKLIKSTSDYICQSLQKSDNSKNRSISQENTYPQILAERNVLVLEDDECIQSLLQCFLELYGAKVSLACTVQDAKKTFSKLFDAQTSTSPIIITDGRIDGDHMNTVQAMISMKKLMPKTKILLFSGLYKEHILDGVDGDEREKLFDVYLQKPANLSLLLGAIQQLAE